MTRDRFYGTLNELGDAYAQLYHCREMEAKKFMEELCVLKARLAKKHMELDEARKLAEEWKDIAEEGGAAYITGRIWPGDLPWEVEE